MLLFSSFHKEIHFKDYPDSQKLKCEKTDNYIFVRTRKGNNIITSYGQPFGKYLYRNCRNKVLISSWEKPTNKNIYTSEDIAMDSDAIIYYKNQ